MPDPPRERTFSQWMRLSDVDDLEDQCDRSAVIGNAPALLDLLVSKINIKWAIIILTVFTLVCVVLMVLHVQKKDTHGDFKIIVRIGPPELEANTSNNNEMRWEVEFFDRLNKARLLRDNAAREGTKMV